MLEPFFSIIIPTYNAAKYIGNCLKSIQNQTFDSFEVIIQDGVSTDATTEIVSCYASKDKRFVLFIERDSGIYDAMNKAIEKANGTYLFFLGSDDTLYNNDVLKTIQNSIIHNNNPLVLYGNSYYVSNKTIYDGKFDLHKISLKNINHQSIFYSKKVFTRYKYITQYKLLADYQLNLKLWFEFSEKNIVYTDAIVSKYSDAGISSITIDLDFNCKKLVFIYHLSKKYKKPLNFNAKWRLMKQNRYYIFKALINGKLNLAFVSALKHLCLLYWVLIQNK